MNLKYKRLPNFYYRCGLLNHSLKDYLEQVEDINQEVEGCLQYGAWLRGEPIRRNGRETTQTRQRGNTDISQQANGFGTAKPKEFICVPIEAKESDRGHMPSPSNLRDSQPWEIPNSEAL